MGNVQTFCESLCGRVDTEESVKRGAESVLAEMRNRAAAGVLLRASSRDKAREPQELLRSVSGETDPTPPDELLRPTKSP